MEQSVRTRTTNGANKRLVFHVRLRRDSLSITTPDASSTMRDLADARCSGIHVPILFVMCKA